MSKPQGINRDESIAALSHRIALRLIESSRYSRMPKAVQRWAFRQTNLTELRWSLRSRLDVALARLAGLGVTDV